MSAKVLVIGGTGMLGRPVAERLKEDNYNVTIMSSNIEKAKKMFDYRFPIVSGDVTDVESLRKPIEGNDYVYINLSAELDPKKYESVEINGTANVARVSKEMGVKQIGYISGASSKGVEKGVLYLDSKVKAERAIIESGVPYTIMRPSWFFESLPLFIQKGRASIMGEQPLKIGWLAASDYACQVSNAFQKNEAVNKCFYNLGPQKMTMMEALEKFCAKHYPTLRPETISFTKAKMLSYLPGMKNLKLVIPFFEYFSKIDENVDPTEANELLGANTTTIDQWLESWKKLSI